ncbi:MAG: hypothetical protein WCP28_07485 [Actinomycetes bacterium]
MTEDRQPFQIPPSQRRSELPEPPVEVLRQLYKGARGVEPEDDEDARLAYWLGLL